jgi:hypothetical protein
MFNLNTFKEEASRDILNAFNYRAIVVALYCCGFGVSGVLSVGYLIPS